MKRVLLLATGFFTLILGVIGLVVPLLPTTPFLILAAACFMRSSPRIHDWLIAHPLLGKILRDWQEHRGIALRYKVISTSLIVVFASYSLWTMELSTPLSIAVGTAILLVLGFIWTRPTPLK
ncbi:MAG: YbaN family protein [Planctomycetes bacterium]|nr:YbaN family protein [Planctomycetota bacterium]